MYFIKSVVFFGVLLLFTAFQSEEWETYHFADGRFSIIAPEGLEEKVSFQETEIGFVSIYNYIYQPKEKNNHNLLYMVTYYDFPEGGMHSDSTSLLKEFFETTMNEAVRTVRGKLVYQDDANLLQYQGKHWRLNYLNDQATIRTKAFIVKNRYYSIQVVSYAESGLNPEIEKFMNSFRLLE